MSSEISRMARCTGSFLRCDDCTRPKTRPASDTRMPTARSDDPFTPMKVTLPRSGRTRLASPPPLGLARATDVNSVVRFMAGMALRSRLRSLGSPPVRSRRAKFLDFPGFRERGYYLGGRRVGNPMFFWGRVSGNLSGGAAAVITRAFPPAGGARPPRAADPPAGAEPPQRAPGEGRAP